MKLMTLEAALIFIIGLTGCTKMESTRKNQEPSLVSHEDPQGYYTCSMHPQVHEHTPGNCPICGMALIKVSGYQLTRNEVKTEKGIIISDRQLQLAGIGRHTVSKKNITFSIPVAGRWISNHEIAFQVYESDLQNIRIASEFIGKSTTNNDKTLSGKITSIDSLIDPSSRTVRVIGQIRNQASRSILDGGFLGEIISVEKDQIAVPEQAILRTGKKDIVYLFTEQQVLKPKTVILGSKAGQEYQILSGLKVGDVISSGPNFLIDSESKIRSAFDNLDSEENTQASKCPPDQYWDISMSMCMAGKNPND